jgi:hypothetical protein
MKLSDEIDFNQILRPLFNKFQSWGKQRKKNPERQKDFAHIEFKNSESEKEKLAYSPDSNHKRIFSFASGEPSVSRYSPFVSGFIIDPHLIFPPTGTLDQKQSAKLKLRQKPTESGDHNNIIF